MKRLLVLALLAALIVTLGPAGGAESEGPATGPSSLEESFSDFVTPGGDILLPRRDYRSEWTHLGTFVVPAEKDKGMGFHDVYTQPESVKAFKRDGRFPDGAVLVKEVNGTHTGKLTTGEASWAGAPAQWFVMVKDRKGRFPDNSLWGKGWGWALFSADNPDVNVATDYKIDCLGCHIPAQANDWIFVEGYPSIRGD